MKAGIFAHIYKIISKKLQICIEIGYAIRDRSKLGYDNPLIDKKNREDVGDSLVKLDAEPYGKARSIVKRL